MNLNEYIRDIRARTSDNPRANVPPYHTDSALTVFINNSRKVIARELKCLERYTFIMPKLYVDEYDLPIDFKSIISIFDVYNQIMYSPLNKENVETTKNFGGLSLYDNMFRIDKNRKKLVLLNPPESKDVQLPFKIKSFDRNNGIIVVDDVVYTTGIGTISVSGNTITISGGLTSQLQVGYKVKDSAGTIGTVTSIVNITTFTVDTSLATGDGTWSYAYNFEDILKWENVKCYIQIYDVSAGVYEYARVSKIEETVEDSEYTLYITGFDLLNDYKNMLRITGSVTLTNGSTTVIGTDSLFLTDLTVGDSIYYDGTNIGTVASITSNTSFELNTNYTGSTASGLIIYVDNRPYFTDGDQIKFVPFVMNYLSLSYPLKYQYEEDQFPLEIQPLISIHACIEAELRRNRPEKAVLHKNDYETEKQNIKYSLDSDEANIYNDSITSDFYNFWR